MLRRPNQWALACTILCTLLALTGCRNLGTPYRGLAGGTTIAPPGTYYRTNNPTMAQNQYYNQNANAQNGGILSTNGAAPTAAGTQNKSNGQWRATGSSTLGPNGLQQPTSSQMPNTASGFASTPSAANGGLSHVPSTNYRSTSIDERLDDTRLGVTDATGVRAPVQSHSPTYPQSRFNVAQAAFQNRNTTFDNSQVVRGNPQVIVGNRQFTANDPYARQSMPTTVIGSPSFSTTAPAATYNGSPVVLSQSTVRADPTTNPSHQADWRARETNPDIFR